MRISAIAVCLLCVALSGCPTESETTTDPAPTGTTGTAPTTETQNTPAPPGQSEPEVDGEASEGETEGEGSATSESSDVSLLELDWDGVLALVANHPGKIVVVDLWSLSCEPCLVEFPNLVTLSREHPDQVACISVATDYQGLANRPLTFYQPKVLEFLQGQGAEFENVLCTTPKPDFFDALELGSEPAIFVFNQAGEQVALFTGLQDDDTEVSYERHVIPFVEGLLIEGG